MPGTPVPDAADKLRPPAYAGFSEQPRHMKLNRVFRAIKRSRDLLVREPLDQEREHLGLPLRERPCTFYFREAPVNRCGGGRSTAQVRRDLVKRVGPIV